MQMRITLETKAGRFTIGSGDGINVILTRIAEGKWVARYHSDEKGYEGDTPKKALWALHDERLLWLYYDESEDGLSGIADDLESMTIDFTDAD